MYLQVKNFGYNQSMRSNHHEGKHDYDTHVHQFLEIVCVLKGSLDITINGVCQSANEGDFAVILPFHAHSYRTPEYCKIWVGVFSTDWVSDFIPTDAFSTVASAVFSPSDATRIYTFDKIPPPHPYLTRETMSEEKARGTKALLYVILSEFFLHAEVATSALHINALSALYAYVYQHYTEPITLKSVAAEIGYTSTYLSHCLSVIPDANFRNIVNGARIERAKRLLKSTDQKIIDIAFESGFASESIFYSAFEKITGTTPHKYRIAQKKEDDREKYSSMLP